MQNRFVADVLTLSWERLVFLLPQGPSGGGGMACYHMLLKTVQAESCPVREICSFALGWDESKKNAAWNTGLVSSPSLILMIIGSLNFFLFPGGFGVVFGGFSFRFYFGRIMFPQRKGCVWIVGLYISDQPSTTVLTAISAFPNTLSEVQ